MSSAINSYSSLLKAANSDKERCRSLSRKIDRVAESSELKNAHSFDVVEFAGSGTFGRVYKVEREGITYAAKVLALAATDEGVPLATIRELGLLASLDHEHVVKSFDIELRQLPFFVLLEFVPSTLHQVVVDRTRISEDSLMRTMTLQILRGMSYLRSRAIVHKDLKPANILVHDNGRLVIADFGVSKALVRRTCSEVEGYPGTYTYAPPDVLMGAVVSYAYDAWSLGCILVFMALGESCVEDCVDGDTEFKIDRIVKSIHAQLGAPPSSSSLCGLTRYKNIDRSDWLQLPSEAALPQRLQGMASEHMTMLIMALLHYEPDQRLDADHAIQHDAFAFVRALRLNALLAYSGPFVARDASTTRRTSKLRKS